MAHTSPAAAADTQPEFLTKVQLGELLQVSPRTIEGWRHRGRFDSDLERRALQGVSFGGKVRWSRTLIMEWVAASAEAAA